MKTNNNDVNSIEVPIHQDEDFKGMRKAGSLAAKTLDEITSVLMTFEEGTTGYLGTSIATPGYFSLRFFGENGVVEVRNPDLSEFAHTSQTGEVTVQTHTGFDMGRAALEGFADQVSGTGKFLISDDDVINGSEALEMIFAAAAN